MISTWYKFSYPQLEDPSHLPHCAHGIQRESKPSKHCDRTGNIPYKNLEVSHKTYLKSEELPRQIHSVVIHIDSFQYLMLKAKKNISLGQDPRSR